MKLRQLTVYPSSNRFTLVTTFDYTRFLASIAIGPFEQCCPHDYDTNTSHREHVDWSVERAKQGKRTHNPWAYILRWQPHPEESSADHPSLGPIPATVLDEFGVAEEELRSRHNFTPLIVSRTGAFSFNPLYHGDCLQYCTWSQAPLKVHHC